MPSTSSTATRATSYRSVCLASPSARRAGGLLEVDRQMSMVDGQCGRSCWRLLLWAGETSAMCHFLPQILVTTQKILNSESMQYHPRDIFVSFSPLMKHVGFRLFDQHMANRSQQSGMGWYRRSRGWSRWLGGSQLRMAGEQDDLSAIFGGVTPKGGENAESSAATTRTRSSNSTR